MSRRLHSIAFLVGLSLTAIGCFRGPSTVVRVVDGKRIVGPFVNERAYASYLQASTLEAEGNLREALSLYRRALRHDAKSADIWTKIGSLECALGESPWASFERALALDSRYEAAWTSLARCHSMREEYEEAAPAARMAVFVEPANLDNLLLLAEALERVGKVEEAGRWLDELAIARPLSLEAHRARLDFAIRAGDSVRKEASARRLAELAPDMSKSLAERVPSLSPLARIDEALLRHDLEGARRLSLEARMGKGLLALRAVSLGRLSEGREQAELALAADPSDSDARVALAMVAELKHDDDALGEALSNLPNEAASLSELGRQLLGELVRMRAGDAMR